MPKARNKPGRRSKGPRAQFTLRVETQFAEELREEARALGLSENDYLAAVLHRAETTRRSMRPATQQDPLLGEDLLAG